MMAGADVSAVHPLVHRARDLDAEARGHKRQSDYHRRAAQSARERQAEIERQCAELGITVTYQPHNPDGEGASPWPTKTRSSISRR